jgi:integrase
MRFLSKGEVKGLFEVLEDDFILTLFTSLALCTASRKKTILHYCVKDVDLDNKIIQSYDFKKETSYQSFLDDRTIHLLKIRLAQCSSPNDKLIDVPEIKDIDRWVSREMKIVLDDLFNIGLDASDRSQRVVIHTLRHTVLSHLGLKNSNIFLIKQISNHSSTSMVERYVKLNSDSGRDEIQNLWD